MCLMLDKLAKLLLFVFLISFSADFKAQPYIGMTDSSNQWNFESNVGACFNSCQDFTYYFDEDTLIGSLTYKKLYKSEVNYFIGARGCNSDSICTVGRSFIAGLRDDTVKRKVYIYDPLIQADTLLYDFDLQLGDTLEPTYYNRYFSGTNDFIVDSVGFDTIGSRIHRKFYIGIDSIITISRVYNLIEGVGGNWGLDFNSIYNPAIDQTFDCFTNSSGFYPKGISSCNIISSTGPSGKIASENWMLYPNPTEGRIELTAEHDFVRARLYSLDGKLLMEQKLQDNQSNSLQIEGEAGVYLLLLETKDGQISRRKLIKQ